MPGNLQELMFIEFYRSTVALLLLSSSLISVSSSSCHRMWREPRACCFVSFRPFARHETMVGEKGVGRCPGKILKFKNKKLHLKCSEDVHSIVLLPLLLTRNHIPEMAFEI